MYRLGDNDAVKRQHLVFPNQQSLPYATQTTFLPARRYFDLRPRGGQMYRSRPRVAIPLPQHNDCKIPTTMADQSLAFPYAHEQSNLEDGNGFATYQFPYDSTGMAAFWTGENGDEASSHTFAQPQTAAYIEPGLVAHPPSLYDTAFARPMDLGFDQILEEDNLGQHPDLMPAAMNSFEKFGFLGSGNMASTGPWHVAHSTWNPWFPPNTLATEVPDQEPLLSPSDRGAQLMDGSHNAEPAAWMAVSLSQDSLGPAPTPSLTWSNHPSPLSWNDTMPDSQHPEIADTTIAEGTLVQAAHPDAGARPGNGRKDLIIGLAGQIMTRDQYLVQARSRGDSYQSIKEKAGFEEAVSTLRGRYRTLTKEKEKRVRRPEWTASQRTLLLKAIMRHRDDVSRGKANTSNGVTLSSIDPAHIPWAKVRGDMIANGGYPFGASSCKKKFLELRKSGALRC